MFSLRTAIIYMTIAAASAFTPQTNTPRTNTALSAEKQPWDVLRFVQQSSKFVSLLPSRSVKRTVAPGETIWQVGTQEFTFAPLDDVVMGGASSSSFRDGRWDGEVTDANNGGFIGIRSTPSLELNMIGCKGIKVTLKGDSVNRRMKIGIRDSKDFNGIVWNSSFDVRASNNKKEMTVTLPFSKLLPTKFARVLTSEEALTLSNIVGLQFVYSKFEYDGDLNPKFQQGTFDIDITKIQAY